MPFLEALPHVLGVISIIAGVIAMQCRKHSHALFFKMTDEGLFGIQYLLLGGYTGAFLNLAGVVRNAVFAYLGIKQKEKALFWARMVFCIMFGAVGFLSWQGYVSLLVIFAKALSTIAYGTTNMKKMRILLCVTSTCWLCYNVLVGSYTGILSDSFTLLSALVGLMRYDLKRPENQA